MMNRLINPRLSLKNSQLIRAAIAGTLSVLSVTSGVVPSLVAKHSLQLHFGATAQAQQPPGDIALYNRVARLIEQQRMKYYGEIEQLLGKDPGNACAQKNAPAQIREICNRFNEAVYGILGTNNMSPEDFKRMKAWCSTSPKPSQCP